MDGTQITLGWAFLAGPAYFEVADISVFSDPEGRDSLGTVFAVLEFRLGEEKERTLCEKVARARAALASGQATVAREAAIQLVRLIHGGGTAASQRAIKGSRLFFRETGENADQAIAEVRETRRAKSLRGHSRRVNFFECLIRDSLLACFRRYGSKEISAEWHLRVAQRFAKKIASVFPPDRANQKLIAGMAEILDAELLQLNSVYKRNRELPTVLDALDLISAGEALKLRAELGGLISNLLFSYSDPLKEAENIRENRKAAGKALQEAGFVARTAGISNDPRVAFAKNPVEAAERTLKIARKEPLNLQTFPPPLKRKLPSPAEEVVRLVAEESGPLTRLLASQQGAEVSTTLGTQAPGTPVSSNSELWSAFKKSTPPGIFDEAGEVLQKVEGTTLLTLVSWAADFSRPDRETLRYGIIHLLRAYRDRIEPADYALAVRIADHTHLLEDSPPVQREEREAGMPLPSTARSLPGMTLFQERGGLGVRYLPDEPAEPAEADAGALLLRSRKRIKGTDPCLRGQDRLQVINRIRETWGTFYQGLLEPVCPPRVWENLTTNFSNRISLVAEFIPSAETCLVMAQTVYEEMVVLIPLKVSVALELALARFSAEEIKDLLEHYPKSVALRALAHSNTLEVIDRFHRNYQAVWSRLAATNLKNIAQAVAKLPYTMGAKNEAEALRKADEVVAAWRAGRWKGGQPYSAGE